MGGRLLVLHRLDQRMGSFLDRREARPGLPSDRDPQQRLLRRPPQRRQPVRGVDRLPRCPDGEARVALSDRPPWCVGLRSSRAAEPRDHRSRGQAHRRRRRRREDRLRLRVRPRHRSAGLAHRGAARSRELGARRAPREDPALPHQTSALHPTGVHRERFSSISRPSSTRRREKRWKATASARCSMRRPSRER